MKYSLYLDDQRVSPDERWIVVRSYDEAVSYIKRHGVPSFISFDHDLGEGKTGLDFAHWLIDQHLDGNRLPDNFSFSVHSANPVGAENIRKLLAVFFRQL